MADNAEILFLDLAGGITVGAVIVFVGVWVVLNWAVTGRLIKAVMSIVLAMALGAAVVSFFRIAESEFLVAFGVVSITFAACSLLLATYRVWRESWTTRPEAWRVWLLIEIIKSLILPMTVFGFGAALVSTIALFATMQQGPQTGQLLLELSVVTAACWAVVTVAGVWAQQRKTS